MPPKCKRNYKLRIIFVIFLKIHLIFSDYCVRIAKVVGRPQKNVAELCKGSTADSDSVCLGSNPSSAAKIRREH